MAMANDGKNLPFFSLGHKIYKVKEETKVAGFDEGGHHAQRVKSEDQIRGKEEEEGVCRHAESVISRR